MIMWSCRWSTASLMIAPDGGKSRARLEQGKSYFRNAGVEHDVINAGAGDDFHRDRAQGYRRRRMICVFAAVASGRSGMAASSNAKSNAKLAINCDMGESFGIWRLGDDQRNDAHIPIANVACGSTPPIRRHAQTCNSQRSTP